MDDGCPPVGPAESGAECENAVDDDADTVVNDGCPAFGGDDAWPLDIYIDRNVDVVDVASYKGILGRCESEPGFNPRYDLDMLPSPGCSPEELRVDILDVALYKPLLASKRNPFQPLFLGAFEEVICRWGIFAIAFRLSRRIWVSVLTSALFNVLLAVNALVKLMPHMEVEVPAWQLAAIVAIKFALAVGYAVFYVRKGLLSTMALRFVAALPTPVLAAFG